MAIRDLIAMIARQIPGTPEFSFLGSQRPGDPERWCADISKISDLGFSPEIDFAEGIAATVDSYLKRVFATTTARAGERLPAK